MDRRAEGLIAFIEDPVVQVKRTVNIEGGIYTRATAGEKKQKEEWSFKQRLNTSYKTPNACSKNL